MRQRERDGAAAFATARRGAGVLVQLATGERFLCAAAGILRLPDARPPARAIAHPEGWAEFPRIGAGR